MGLWVERVIGGFKYLLAISMMLNGIETTLLPLRPLDGALGYIYSTRIALIWLGIIFFISGLILLVGKLRRSKSWTGTGLMAIYLCYVFGTILQFVAFTTPSAWATNAIMAAVTGALWLRWRLKVAYINPNHFRRDIVKIETDQY